MMKNLMQSKIMKQASATIAFSGVILMSTLLFSANAQAENGYAADNQQCLATFSNSFRALHSTEQHNLCELTKDKVVMVVNTASQCGYTGQFEDLETIYQEYKEQGLVILGFPSDSFRQEHADEAETADVCFRNFGVSFPMMATSPVTGSSANNVFKTLTQATEQAPRWNFHKYLVSADGQQIMSFSSPVKPTDTQIVSAIASMLEQL